MPNYEIVIGFDDRVAGRNEHRAYFNTMEKHGAFGIGHDRRGNPSLFIESKRPLSRKVLQRELGNNKILSISRR